MLREKPMKHGLIKLFALGIANLLLFILIFELFRNETFFSATLGRITTNYERTGGWDNYEIKEVDKPYLQIESSNFERWDADIFRCIKENMYSTEEGCYHKVRGAFFPLFPLLWKITGLNGVWISVLNYLLFIVSIGILIRHLLSLPNVEKILIFLVLISLPSAVVYLIPYSEALFMFTMTFMVLGIVKKKYRLYFGGALFMAMVRPATVFILFAIVAIELFGLVSLKNFRIFARQILSKSLPFAIGYFLAIFIQFLYSGSWRTMLDAQNYWAGGLQPVRAITDWSIEGFGMNLFAVCFVGLPSIIFIVYTLLGRRHIMKQYAQSMLMKRQGSGYLMMLSAWYIAGIMAFTMLTSGGNLHSFFRFTLCSPPFFLLVILLLGKETYIRSRIYAGLVLIPLVILILVLVFVEYGGNRFDFSFAGLYLLILLIFFLFLRHLLDKKLQFVITLLLVLLNNIWNTYLLNIFFSNGWIFT